MTTQTQVATNAAWTYTLLAAVVLVAVSVAIVWFYAS